MAKVEGKGNGIKTVIVNMSDVAKALGCPPTYPCKFFGCELGAQTQFAFKDDRYIVNGSHEAGKLQQLLDVFIKKFILCTKCENPETTLHPNERKETIRQTCKACGHQAMLNMTHKLTTYILKNPPDVKIDQLGSSKTQKKDRTKVQSSGSPNGETGTNGTAEDEWDDEDWGEDTSDAAVASRMQELSAGVKHLTLSSQAHKSQAEKLEIFLDYCKNKKETGVLVPGADMAVFKDIASEADSLEIKEGKGVMALVHVLMDEDCVKQIAQYRILLLHFTNKSPKSQKYLLGAFEKLIEMKQEALLPRVSHILKSLYDQDVVDEEVLLEWGAKASKKHVSKNLSEQIHAQAAPFIKWLNEAEEEESESEEEDDLEIEYDDKARVVSLKDQEAKPAAKKIQTAELAKKPGQDDEDENESDIDIDDI